MEDAVRRRVDGPGSVARTDGAATQRLVKGDAAVEFFKRLRNSVLTAPGRPVEDDHAGRRSRSVLASALSTAWTAVPALLSMTRCLPTGAKRSSTDSQ